MDQDDKELVRRLMAQATAMIEDAIGTAVAGQSERLSAAGYARAGRRLEAAARDIATLAEAAAIVADSGAKAHRKQRKSGC